jgi:hypothetical protein
MHPPALHQKFYTLDENGNAVRAPSFDAWSEWFAQHFHDRFLARDELPSGVRVSTVFLGIDHSFGHGPPRLWETVIFGGPHDQYLKRYDSREEAVAGHQKALQLAKSGRKASS